MFANSLAVPLTTHLRGARPVATALDEKQQGGGIFTRRSGTVSRERLPKRSRAYSSNPAASSFLPTVAPVGSPAMKVRLHAALILAMAVAAASLVAAGCGGSSKPDYCSKVSDLQQSVNDLKGVQLQSGALSTIQTDVQKVQSNATAVVSSAKQDFPTQTSALQSSVSTLSATINALPPSPTPQQLAPLVPQIRSVGTASQNLSNATNSACD